MSTVTIGIPTCYGGEALVDAVASIRASSVQPDHIIICADRTPLSPKVQQGLEALGATVIWNEVQGSQFKKLKQIVDRVTTDLFVFTQDDILFDKHTLKNIVRAFEFDDAVTLVGARVMPLRPVTMFEATMATMVRMNDRIGRFWNAGQNHLLASGRCLAFRTATIQAGRLPEEVINGDMFLYLENKRIGKKFAYAEDAAVWIRCPQHLQDQLGPSSRYQYSQEEMSAYFNRNLSEEYAMPRSIIVRAGLVELTGHPFAVFGYALVFLYSLEEAAEEASVKYRLGCGQFY